MQFSLEVKSRSQPCMVRVEGKCPCSLKGWCLSLRLACRASLSLPACHLSPHPPSICASVGLLRIGGWGDCQRLICSLKPFSSEFHLSSSCFQKELSISRFEGLCGAVLAWNATGPLPLGGLLWILRALCYVVAGSHCEPLILVLRPSRVLVLPVWASPLLRAKLRLNSGLPEFEARM